MACAKEIMTEKVTTLLSSTDILDAVAVFNSKKYTSVPVTTNTGEIAGLLTEIILVRMLVMHQVQPDKYKKIAHCLEFLETPVFIEPYDPMTVVIKAVMHSPSKRVVVSLDKFKILGIISPKDLIRALASGDKTAQSIQKEVEKAHT